ncbi:hypothetical protein ACSQ67_019851 [Phaseolus vulgaris]
MMSTVFSTAGTLSPPRWLSSTHKLSDIYPLKFHRNRLLPILSKSRAQPLIANSLLSDKFPTVGARSTGPIPPSHLIEVVKTAAHTGAQLLRFLSRLEFRSAIVFLWNLDETLSFSFAAVLSLCCLYLVRM